MRKLQTHRQVTSPICLSWKAFQQIEHTATKVDFLRFLGCFPLILIKGKNTLWEQSTSHGILASKKVIWPGVIFLSSGKPSILGNKSIPVNQWGCVFYISWEQQVRLGGILFQHFIFEVPSKVSSGEGSKKFSVNHTGSKVNHQLNRKSGNYTQLMENMWNFKS